MPVHIRRMSGFYVRSNGLPTSKGAITREELAASSIRPELLNPPVSGGLWPRVRKALRLAARIPIALPLVVKLTRRTGHSRADIGIIAATILHQRFLTRNPGLLPIINSDLSPGQVMLACAAQAIGRPTVWWQDDFHYTDSVPFRVSAGVVLNRNGLRALQARNPDATVLRRNIRKTNPAYGAPLAMRVPTDVKHAGVAVNGLFSGAPAELETLSRIRRAISVNWLELRLHPTANMKFESLPEGIRISPQHESVQEFSSRMDIVFSGNSAIQYKLVMAGTPVIHVSGLDGLEFDLYEYVDNGLVFGSTDIDQTILERARAFYRGIRFRETIQANEAEQFNLQGLPLSNIKNILTKVKT